MTINGEQYVVADGVTKVQMFSVKQRIPTGGNIRYKKLYLKLAFNYNISMLFYGQVFTLNKNHRK